jgi:thiamine transport system ATP-binding protein
MLQVLGASVRFGDLAALTAVDMSVADGEVLALLGPSGSGKTTLLRAIAGLQHLDAGSILWNGTALASVAAHARRFGLVFQDFALFPHLDVGRNVSFGLRMARVDASEQRRRVARALERVELSGFEKRRVTTLSGGQAQRVALARALAPEPRMLLFDEPLGSLDRPLRERLVVEIRELLNRLGTTALYVTHDQSEAFAVADRIAIIRDGSIEQRGTAEEVWRRPATEFVARFLGFQTIVPATVGNEVADAGPLGSLPLPGTPAGPVRLVVRPDAVVFDPAGHLEGVVRTRTFRGDHALLVIEVNGIRVETGSRFDVAEGARVRFRLDPDGVVPLEPA